MLGHFVTRHGGGNFSRIDLAGASLIPIIGNYFRQELRCANRFSMCNLYSLKSNQEAIRDLVKYIGDFTGNMPPLPGIFPDYMAPIARNNQGTRELAMARWGMPSPVFALDLTCFF